MSEFGGVTAGQWNFLWGEVCWISAPERDLAQKTFKGLPSFTGHLMNRRKYFLKFLIFTATSGLISPSSPLLHQHFFSCTCPRARFTTRLCWNQSCPELHTHLLKYRGGNERMLCKLTKSWWVLDLWCFLAFGHIKIWHLLAHACGFLCWFFLTPQSYPTALQSHSQIVLWCCHCWLLDSK